jgi:acetoacetyl-CoA synthetase
MAEGDLLWQPAPDWIESSRLTHYMRWLDRGFETYDQLWRWSVEDLDAFWGSLW